MHVSCGDQPLNQTFSNFFQREECPKDDYTSLVVEEQQVVDLFQNTTITLEDGRYEVRLPRKEGALPLGETRSIAERRLIQNEKSLQRKNKFAEFQEQVNDYGKQGHAELVPTENMSSEVAYLPLHGVEKST